VRPTESKSGATSAKEEDMRGSKHDLPVAAEFDTPDGHVTLREIEWGDMNVAMENFPAGADTRPLFKGLPDDACQCPHWGYIVKGGFRVIYEDHEEVLTTGDVYYLHPGHNLVYREETELVEFSPRGKYQETMEVASRNLAAMLAGAN
jgi:hypothetical protein